MSILIFLTPPHCEIDFLFASRRMSIFIFLLPPHGKIEFASRQMSILFFFRLLAATFHSRLMAVIDFLFASRQESSSFCLHGDSGLTAVIDVLFASW
jgi:hypothetical protein